LGAGAFALGSPPEDRRAAMPAFVNKDKVPSLKTR